MENLGACEAWRAAYEVQRATLTQFYDLCARTLGSACALKPLEPRLFSMQANLFSTLFIMATAALGLVEEKVRFYAVVNQCLRTVVTGCDNILDDEYKEVVPVALEGSGTRFRSVLQIMTGDAVLARLMTEAVAEGSLDAAKAARLSGAVLAVLIPSGVQEHEEESGLNKTIPRPEEMIGDVLYRKTGLLFQAPLKLVAHVGDATEADIAVGARALSDFGIACQILDDAMDVSQDLSQRHLNLVLSLAYHGDDPAERDTAQALASRERLTEAEAVEAAANLPIAAEACRLLAAEYFSRAYQGLCKAIPAFDPAAAKSLGTLVQMAIMKDRFIAPLGTLV
ncbi:MAG: polyprenyl synthetase family protein [FCB group bacterium]|jgi:hypothetical protein|nr:polyprenyl synthetase family protein [FCB group bacterium]